MLADCSSTFTDGLFFFFVKAGLPHGTNVRKGSAIPQAAEPGSQSLVKFFLDGFTNVELQRWHHLSDNETVPTEPKRERAQSTD